MTASLRVALFGASAIGRFHAHTLAYKIPDATLAAVVDMREEKARQLAESARAPKWTTDPAEVMGDPEIHAVVIATPDGTHAPLTAMAAAAGKHVFCEKPIGLDLPEIDAALGAVTRAGMKLQIGFQRRFDSGYVRARRLIDEGRIGKIHMVQSRSRDPRPNLNPEALQAWSGLFQNMAVHDFDVIRFLSGAEVREIYAVAAALVDPAVAEAGKTDTAAVTMRLSTGAIATLDLSRQDLYGHDVRAEVLGSEGSVRIELEQQTPLLHLTPEGVRHDYPYGFLDRFAPAYEEEMRAFVECALADTQPQVTGEDGRAATVLAIAANQSVATGLPVKLEH